MRQTERHLHDDPPGPGQLEELGREVRGIIEQNVPGEVREAVTRGIAVAGTATQLAGTRAGAGRGRDGRDTSLHGHTLVATVCGAFRSETGVGPAEAPANSRL